MELKELIKSKVGFKFGEFWPHPNLKFPFMFKNELFISDPHLIDLVTDKWKTNFPKVDLIICAASFAIPLASVLSQKTGLNLCILRRENRETMKESFLEGVFSKNQSCVLIDDTYATGSTFLKLIDYCKLYGIKPVKAYSILDVDPVRVVRPKNWYNGMTIESEITFTELFEYWSPKLSERESLLIKAFIDDYKIYWVE